MTSTPAHRTLVIAAMLAFVGTAVAFVLWEQSTPLTIDPTTRFTTEPSPVLGMPAHTFYGTAAVALSIAAGVAAVGAVLTRPRAAAG